MPKTQSSSYRMIFAERLRQLRRARGFKTARAFAEAIGIDQNAYTRYERGEVEPNISLIERMWTTLGLPPNELFGGAFARPGFGEHGQNFVAAGDGANTPTATHNRLQPLSRLDRLAWAVAKSAAGLRRDHNDIGGDIERWRQAARHFAELKGDPLAALARIVDHPSAAGTDRATREELSVALRAFVGALEGGRRPASRPARKRARRKS
jgi:transcriptional regulator with XRE-family HTH domain